MQAVDIIALRLQFKIKYNNGHVALILINLGFLFSLSRKPFPLKIMIDQKQLENVEYFNYLGSMITNDARCTREIKSRFSMARAAFNKKTLFNSKLDLNLRKKLVK
jgi:hypothetical protein